MTSLQPDAFEEIFLKLEEESERRALEAERAARPRHRHRGSVSISRFGRFEEPIQQTTIGPSQTPPHGTSTLAPFYGAQLHNHSADSLSDESSFGDEVERSAESEHITQVHRIAGRQSLPRSVGGMLQRTLALSRSKNDFSSSGIDTNVVIGVVVEEDHVEEEPRESPPRQANHAKAYAHVQAPSTLRSQSSRWTIPGAGMRETNVSWRSKAGELFKRKIRPRGSTLWTMTPAQQS
ncbi:hypothetical protein BJV74DRAFT_815609 [Russula compacta]|nr:hypothetical protein BJV74DRAFT_815609 [Russula compacta]